MNDELRKRLLDLGMLEPEVTKLVEAGVESGEDLALLSTQEICEWSGCKPMVAVRVQRSFGPQQAATIAAHPSVVLMQLGEDDSVEDLIASTAAGNVKAKRRLHQEVGDLSIFVRSLETGIVDVTLSNECYQDYQTFGRTRKTWQGIPTETFKSIFQIKEFAHPRTGMALDPDDPWMILTPELRVLAVYGYLTGMLKPGENEDVLIAQLQQENLRGQWSKIQKAFIHAKTTDDPFSIQAQMGLYVREEGSSAHMSNAFLSTKNVVQVPPSPPVSMQPIAPHFGPGVFQDFKDLTMFYINGDKQGMLQFLIQRAEFLDAWDISSPADIAGVPLEALLLLRAGVHEKVWIFQNQQSTLEGAYGMQAIIAYMGKPKDAFYQAVERFCPASLAQWVGEILYHPAIDTFHGRPRPYGGMSSDVNWKGKRIVGRGY